MTFYLRDSWKRCQLILSWGKTHTHTNKRNGPAGLRRPSPHRRPRTRAEVALARRGRPESPSASGARRALCRKVGGAAGRGAAPRHAPGHELGLRPPAPPSEVRRRRWHRTTSNDAREFAVCRVAALLAVPACHHRPRDACGESTDRNA